MRHLIVITAWLLLASSGCGSRTALQQPHDGALFIHPDAALARPDSSRPDSSRPPLDQAATCPAASRWGFVTDAPPTKPTTIDREFTGQLAYHGPITVPLASAPFFDHEIRLLDDYSGQTLLVLQYYLPAGYELPVKTGEVYTFILRRRLMFEGYAEALVIQRPTSGLWPLLFVGDPSTNGPALERDDKLMAPLTVAPEKDPRCSATAVACGSDAFLDRLRFRATTGAGISEVLLEQGWSGIVTMMGVEYVVMNVAAYRVGQPCADESPTHASWFALIKR